jgi:outer membrane protein OmpA-like peptidoglycan-associated protein
MKLLLFKSINRKLILVKLGKYMYCGCSALTKVTMGTNISKKKLFISGMNFLLVITILFSPYYADAQKSNRERRGDAYYEVFSYYDAIQHYSRVNDITPEGKLRLAESYRKTGQYLLAERVYEGVVNSEFSTPEDLFNYASILRINGKYAESNLWMERFHQMAPEDLRGRSFIANVSELPRLRQDQGQYLITHLGINGPYQEFGATFYGDKIVFASTRKPVQLSRRVYNWNENPFLDLYIADFDGYRVTNPRPFYGSRMSNKWHEGPASFARGEELMAFTRSNYGASASDGTIRLEIYFSEKTRTGSWSNPVPFKLNNPEYSVSHPFLTEDGNTMYFSSDMPGGRGGADIYRIRRSTNGSWGQAENLGDGINTEGDEFFPFFHEKEKVLFFSSNGHMGLGGLDIFLAPQMGDGNYSYAINAGANLNSRFDDFSLVMDNEMRTGFFASNREGGSGDDDIYLVQLLKPLIFGKLISGTVRDNRGLPVRNAEVTLLDGNDEPVRVLSSGDSGRFEFVADHQEDTWKITGQKDGYFDGEISVTFDPNQESISINLLMEKDPEIALYFSVIDQQTKRPVQNARIELTNISSGEKIDVVISNEGEFIYELPEKRIGDNVNYGFRIEAPGYLLINGNYIRTFDKDGRYDVFDELNIVFKKVEPGKTRLGELIRIERIEFDTYRHNLSPEIIVELEKVIDILNDNPTMVLEVGSHTDCRGSTQLNQQLSARRAQTMADYIRERISNPRRVTHTGYGRTVLLNECDCFIIAPQFCTEEQHAENRRTEFIIIRM